MLARLLESVDAARVDRLGLAGVIECELVNGLLGARDGELVPVPPELWTGLRAPASGPLAASDLLVNADGQPNIGSELRAEPASTDGVDLICAFVIRSGVVHHR